MKITTFKISYYKWAACSENGKKLVLMNTFLYRGFNVSAPGQLQTE